MRALSACGTLREPRAFSQAANIKKKMMQCGISRTFESVFLMKLIVKQWPTRSVVIVPAKKCNLCASIFRLILGFLDFEDR